ncbi:DUF2285 domain-containing protein [Sphingomonas donggukensis]|uniref:DUF2285 domain-containing protein n=1 Tax=Sphingomonas donggukensis TaxID=2949093 RepID=A0ABY4TU24_9SPHN|nr:DUF2285 domain-containing protein [Sphingomonas donggukensis]URW75896.1 DUF2285 domain-containing protein [Sphingomonas donggukensis]
MFAWEWLRRTPAYRHSWARTRGSGLVAQARAAHAFGLVALAPPTLAATEARPIWLARHDPQVLRAHVLSEAAVAQELLDIRRLAVSAAIGFDEDDAEHWRLVVAGHAIRIDVHDGTLLGGPTLLRFELQGLAAVRPKLPPLDLLVRGALGLRPRPTPPREGRAARWIDELRTADALDDGATQHEIARALFEASVPASGWRTEGESYRLRVQRLVRAARARLRNPLDRAWFR